MATLPRRGAHGAVRVFPGRGSWPHALAGAHEGMRPCTGELINTRCFREQKAKRRKPEEPQKGIRLLWRTKKNAEQKQKHLRNRA